jgi:spermidine/putrescine transport system permease protein
VLLGVVYNYLPLMILPLFVAFDRVGPALREASKDLGANRWRTFTQVTLPMARPGIAAGILLVFIPLMGDYITATVLGGARGTMVGQLVASQFQTAQNWALGSAMAVLLILVIAATVLVGAAIAYLVTWPLVRRRRLRLADLDAAEVRT